MDNCTYDLIKIMHELSRVNAFIEKHGLKDSKKNETSKNALENLQKDLVEHMRALHKELSKCKIGG